MADPTDPIALLALARGTLTQATAALIAARVSLDVHKAQMQDYFGGSVTGGNGQGLYPITMPDGTTVLQPCPAKIAVLTGVVATRAALAAVPAPITGMAYLTAEIGRPGTWAWRAGDCRALITADPLQIAHVASGVSPDGAAGCWVRSHNGALSVAWAGAVADANPDNLNAATDNAGAINATIQLAKAIGARVYLPSRGWGVKSMIVVPGGVEIYGDGPNADAYTRETGSCLVGLTEGMVVLKCSSGSRLTRFAVNGSWRARFGVWCDGGARPSLQDIDIVRCKRASYLLDNTQNGTFINCCSRFSHAVYLLMNGARNNSFFQGTGEVNRTFYPGNDYDNTCLLDYLIDVTDPFGIGTTTYVTQSGNDLNRHYGGIYERSPLAIRVRNPNGYTDRGAIYGTSYFQNCEFTAARIVDTNTVAFDGTMRFHDPCFITDDQVTPPFVGTKGRIEVTGNVNFSGANQLAWRGVTQSHNFADLIRVRQSSLNRNPLVPNNEGAISSFFPCYGKVPDGFDPVTKALTFSNVGSWGQSFDGLSINTPFTNVHGSRCTMMLVFTVSGLAAGEALSLFIGASAPYYRRQITPTGARGNAGFPNGTYMLAIGLAGDEGGTITFGKGNAATSFTLTGIGWSVAS